MQEISHPNLRLYHEYFLAEQYLYIVTEYCEKGDLE